MNYGNLIYGMWEAYAKMYIVSNASRFVEYQLWNVKYKILKYLNNFKYIDIMSSDLKKNEKQMFKAICEGNWEVVYELLKKYPNFLTYDFDDSQCKLLHCIAH